MGINTKVVPKVAPLTSESTTANYGWTKPTVGASNDVWGGMINADLDSIDNVVHGIQVQVEDAGSSQFGSMVFGNVNLIQTAQIPITINNIVSLSYNIPGDGGGASYHRVSAPAVGGVQSADGAFWKYVVNGPVRLEQFGGVADGTTDNYAAFNIAIQVIRVGVNYVCGPEIQLLPGVYYFSQTLDLKVIIKIRGSGGVDAAQIAATTMLFAQNIPGVIVNLSNTLGQTGQVPPGTPADGCMFEGLQIASKGGTGRTNHGFTMYARAVCRDVYVYGFPGDGFHLDSNVGGVNPVEANCNTWLLDHCITSGCKGNGLLVRGADSNAGLAISFECLDAGACGILDYSFLGNTYIGTEIDACGSNGLGKVSYSGSAYQLISSTANVGATTTPGTNGNVWYRTGSAASEPAWSSSGTYEPECPILIDGLSNLTTLHGTYIESGFGFSHLNGPSVAWGGQSRDQWTNASNFIFPILGYGNFINCPLGVGGVSTSASGNTIRAYVGGDPANGQILTAAQGSENTWYLQFSGANLRLSYGNTASPFSVMGPNTTFTASSNAAQPYLFVVDRFGLGGFGTGHAIVMTVDTAPPTSGEAGYGWIVHNGLPTPGGNVGWICTTAGTNGSTAVWKAFGTIAT